ncbi:MAG TPA: hypothetical protein VEO01_00870 [Pseudonocardiaceae bacterium]|nr:hypothetical protein [Pseudonocardiaceae bacterium]
MPEPDRRVARAAGERRVQTVTTWTTAGAVVGAAVLSALLGHGTVSAANSQTTVQNQPNGTQTGTDQTGGGQLQAPDFLPGSSGGGGRHAATGGS